MSFRYDSLKEPYSNPDIRKMRRGHTHAIWNEFACSIVLLRICLPGKFALNGTQYQRLMDYGRHV
jgi:hypothetical protein